MLAALLTTQRLPAPPDGGLCAWTSVAAGFLTYSLCVGLQYAQGLLLSAVLADADFLAGAPRSSVSWMASMETSMFLLGSLPAGLLRPHLGARGTMLLGAALLTGGALLAAAAPSLPVLVAAMCLFGLGTALPSTVVLTGVQAWFLSLRGTASGLVVCGSGFGAVVFGPLLQAQIDAGGWRQAMQCIALVSAIGLPLFALGTVPLLLDPQQQQQQQQEASAGPPPSAQPEVEASLRLQRHFEHWPCPEEELGGSSGAPAPGGSQLAALRASQPFLCFLAMIALYGGAWFIVIAHFNSSCRENGTSAEEAAVLVSMQGVFNILGRLAMGFAADRLTALGVPKIALLQCNVLVMGSATLALAVPALQASKPYQFVYAAVNGGFGGSVPALQAPILVDIVGLENLSLAFGLFHAAQAPVVLLAPVAAGALRAATGSWVLVWALTGSVVLLGVGVISCMQGLPRDKAPLTVRGVLGLLGGSKQLLPLA
jgi:MFS family permease